MNPNAIISAEVSGKVITIVGAFSGTRITFLGGSCPASVKPGQTADSISLSPGDKEEVVAIRTTSIERHGKNPSCNYDHFILPIVPKNGEPWIICDKTFVPKRDRIGQIVPDLGLTVRIGDEFFLSPILLNPYYKGEAREDACRGYRMLSVDGANLLCRFMAGQVEADEVKKAATELVVQTVDVPAMKSRIAELEDENIQCGTNNANLLVDLRTARTEASERELADLQKINVLKAQSDRVIAGCQELINGNHACMLHCLDSRHYFGGFTHKSKPGGVGMV